MSVQQTVEVVPLNPVALTPWAALRVAVHQDTPEMENLVRVRNVKGVYNVHLERFLSAVFRCVGYSTYSTICSDKRRS